MTKKANSNPARGAGASDDALTAWFKTGKDAGTGPYTISSWKARDEFELTLEDLGTQGVPAAVERAGEAIDPLGGRMVRRVHRGRREVAEERTVGRGRVVTLDPADRVVGEVLAVLEGQVEEHPLAGRALHVEAAPDRRARDLARLGIGGEGLGRSAGEVARELVEQEDQRQRAFVVVAPVLQHPPRGGLMRAREDLSGGAIATHDIERDGQHRGGVTRRR